MLTLCACQLKILRQLVELQLTHGPAIKSAIDRAWGVVHNKHKKNQATEGKPDPSDPMSQENLPLLPLGQDNSRKRYWITDGPCTYLLLFHPGIRICVYLWFCSIMHSISWHLRPGHCRFEFRYLVFMRKN